MRQSRLMLHLECIGFPVQIVRQPIAKSIVESKCRLYRVQKSKVPARCRGRCASVDHAHEPERSM